jgi:hypothetical protein
MPSYSRAKDGNENPLPIHDVLVLLTKKYKKSANMSGSKDAKNLKNCLLIQR